MEILADEDINEKENRDLTLLYLITPPNTVETTHVGLHQNYT
jgi:hypothetical protein